jgi:soluble lytic murein transglycosylase
MLYMESRYASAAAEFGTAALDAHDHGARDALYYWNARALERCGHADAAAAVFRRVALSIDSNYYPALAAMRINIQPSNFPAAEVSAPAAPIPVVGDPLAQFHLTRVLALRDMALGELEAGELRVLNAEAAGDQALRNFVLAEMTSCGAYYDALITATKMAARGELNPLVAERLRYPRGYWDLVNGAAARNALDPYLVAALIRQESLFDPKARSSSDARGLMQLLPSTAERYASVAGVAGSPLDLYDPATSVQLGTTYLRQLFAMFNGDAFRAVAAYNGGEQAVAGWLAKYPGEDDDQWVENIGFRETREYVKKVIGGRREYDLLYRSGGAVQTPLPVSSPSAMMSPLPG